MRCASSRCLALVAFAAGCSANQPPSSGGDDPAGVTQDPQPSGNPTGGKGGGGGSCKVEGRPGDVVATFDVAPGGSLVDKLDNIAVSTTGRIALALTTSDAPGRSVVLGPDGSVLASFAFGRVVAADAADHLFIAGGFTTAMDFGLGVMTPNGNIDTFVVEVDAKGRVIAQFQLDQCGDGVTSIAVSADGRIAVSGTAMGTVVIDANGKQLFVVDFAGAVAFDPQGNLVAFGAAGTGLALVTFDRGGNRLATTSFASSGLSIATSVAVGANGAIAIGGNTFGSLDLFGTAIRVRFTADGVRFTGSFAAMIDAMGTPVLVGDLGGTETNGVAIDAMGNLVVGGTQLSNAFGRHSVLTKFDAAGILVLSIEQLGNIGPSASHGVAVDACGNIFVSVDAGRSLLDMSQLVVELAP